MGTQPIPPNPEALSQQIGTKNRNLRFAKKQGHLIKALHDFLTLPCHTLLVPELHCLVKLPDVRVKVGLPWTGFKTSCCQLLQLLRCTIF